MEIISVLLVLFFSASVIPVSAQIGPDGRGVVNEYAGGPKAFTSGADLEEGNLKEADELLESIKRSASAGDADAQYLLATLFLEGDGIVKDQSEATKLYSLAASQGHDNAQLKLGYCHKDGLGVPRNNFKAYIWFNISASNGGELNGLGRAGELMAKIRRTLSLKEIEKADKKIKHLKQEISDAEKKNYSKIMKKLNRDGWKITMRKDDDGSHKVEAKKDGKTSVSSAPNWRVAFISVRNQCEMWPQ
ncbi:sel1 repeat family protein [Akkermansiaceae bacterium]|jgi:TPR repeat protein|nr:sel1 repeat family protein [Verrucomicrobiota bacterium]MDA7515997.1 sel1 repeat family protein [Akkermansiaceae bacterium]MDB4658673.1 sel1 repeat family protein [bacterium]MBT6167467.1 sel1 repeat family protein [Verrucomicrobiota bacterium]MBT7969395.1 sel1 repeat family protein [Verrucomicrobiota bacterium]